MNGLENIYLSEDTGENFRSYVIPKFNAPEFCLDMHIRKAYNVTQWNLHTLRRFFAFLIIQKDAPDESSHEKLDNRDVFPIHALGVR